MTTDEDYPETIQQLFTLGHPSKTGWINYQTLGITMTHFNELIALGGCPRMKIVARESEIELDFRPI
ncbi:MAG: hypothetical protein Q9M28_08355 [Mariprofundaceae bacterium]|nr:hypothetical protein [Mariprofundaceae bacterium]